MAVELVARTDFAPAVVEPFSMLTASPEWSLTSRYQTLVSTADAGAAARAVRPAAAQTATIDAASQRARPARRGGGVRKGELLKLKRLNAWVSLEDTACT